MQALLKPLPAKFRSSGFEVQVPIVAVALKAQGQGLTSVGFHHYVEVVLLMDKILHDLKDSKLWELWYIPYNG